MNLGVDAAAFGLGATLGILPGPVQMVLLGEATRGGAARGFRAMVGANGTMGILLLGLAGGVAVITPGSGELRVLRVAGGLFLLFLAADAFRTFLRRSGSDPSSVSSHGSSPLIRGVLSVVLNPGAWIFLATTAAALFATAQRVGGHAQAVTSALAMLAGVAVVDGTMVMLGHEARRFEARAATLLTPIIGAVLAVFGLILVFEGLSLR